MMITTSGIDNEKSGIDPCKVPNLLSSALLFNSSQEEMICYIYAFYYWSLLNIA